MERHTPLYKRPHSWQCISEWKPSHEVKGTACRAQRQDCIKAQIWGRLHKNVFCTEGSQEHSGFHNSQMEEVWHNLGYVSQKHRKPKLIVEPLYGATINLGLRCFLEIQPRTLPRTVRPAKLSNWWRRALSRLVTKNLMVTLIKLHDHICRWEKPTEGQTSLQHSTDLGFTAVWPNSFLSSVKTHENTLGICKTAPKGLSDTPNPGVQSLLRHTQKDSAVIAAKGASTKYSVKGLNTYVNVIFQFFLFNKSTDIPKILCSLCHWGTECRLMRFFFFK